MAERSRLEQYVERSARIGTAEGNKLKQVARTVSRSDGNKADRRDGKVQMQGDSIVLEEEIDPNYTPTESEILEYAKWLGMDPEHDKELFWIAREGLKAPLPDGWKPCKTTDTADEIYYYNFTSGESSSTTTLCGRKLPSFSTSSSPSLSFPPRTRRELLGPPD